MESPNIYGVDISFSTPNDLFSQIEDLQSTLSQEFDSLVVGGSDGDGSFHFVWSGWISNPVQTSALVNSIDPPGLDGYDTLSWNGQPEPLFNGADGYHAVSQIVGYDNPEVDFDIFLSGINPLDRPGVQQLFFFLFPIENGFLSLNRQPFATFSIQTQKIGENPGTFGGTVTLRNNIQNTGQPTLQNLNTETINTLTISDGLSLKLKLGSDIVQVEHNGQTIAHLDTDTLLNTPSWCTGFGIMIASMSATIDQDHIAAPINVSIKVESIVERGLRPQNQ